MQQDSFILISNADEQDPRPILVNISQIVIARVIQNGVTLHLTGNHDITLKGSASEELIATLMRHSIMTSGQSIPESAIPWR